MQPTSTLTSSNLLSDSELAPSTATLNRRKILVTGCSTGIGYYCAKQLHNDGHIVVAACRRSEDVERLIAEGLHSVALDLDDSGSIVEGIRDAMTITNGELDILINNAAYGQAGAVEDLSRTALEKQFSSNLFGPHELTIKLLKTLLASDAPRIIQIASIASFIPWRYRGAYCASKFALKGLTDSMRLELADTAIKLCFIQPGMITSAFRQNEYDNFLTSIDVNRSRHIDDYKRIIKYFDANYRPAIMKTERAVYKKVRHAVMAKYPKRRYLVTRTAYLMYYLQRLLPSSLFEWMLSKNHRTPPKNFD